MKNTFTYDITENRFYLNGEPITLTTDDILWAKDVHASGIQPFGGIQENTIWKKNRTLTDTMRQLIEKAVSWYPYITYKVTDVTDESGESGEFGESASNGSGEINEFENYIDINKSHRFKLLLSYHDGMYLNNQSANCKLLDISVTSKNKNYKIDQINNFEYIIEYINTIEDESEDETLGDLIVTYTYSKSETPPFIMGASDEYIKDITIPESTTSFNIHIGLYNPIIIYTGNKVIPETITDQFIIDLLNDKSSATDILDPNCLSINFNNKIKDNIFVFAIPSEKKYSKLLWLYTPKEITTSELIIISDEVTTYVDYIDYSDLLEKSEIDYNNVKYHIYKIIFADNLLNKNNYTIVLE